MNICPYCFSELDKDNLAYEIQFIKPYDIKTLDKTVLKGRYQELLTRVVDERSQETWYGNEIASANSRYLLEEKRTGKENGMEKLKRLIVEEWEKYQAKFAEIRQIQGDAAEEELYSLEMTENLESSKVYSFYKTGAEVMRAYPCCQCCHSMLPWEWFEAEDFCGISLLSLVHGGKTTMALSILANNLRCLRTPGKDIIFTPALKRSTNKFYEKLYKDADNLVQNREYPMGTQPKRLCPIFINMDYKGRRMAIGLYDVSGESLKDSSSGDGLIEHLRYMSGHIYLIDPLSMRVRLQQTGVSQTEEKKEHECEQLDIVSQGKLQMENLGKTVSAESLLKKGKTEKPAKNSDQPFALFYDIADLLREKGGTEMLKKQHMAFTIMMSDKLENSPDIKEIPFQELLFQRLNCRELWDEDNSLMREGIVRDVFEKFLIDKDSLEDIADYYGSASYHCVSSTGCGNMTIAGQNDKLAGEYNPIRVQEPLLECIKAKLRSNGWY